MNLSDLKIFFCARFDVERSPSQSESEVIPPPSYAQVIDLNKWAIFWLNCLWELPVLGLNAIKKCGLSHDDLKKNIGFQKMNPITYNSITRSSVLKGYLKFIQEPSCPVCAYTLRVTGSSSSDLREVHHLNVRWAPKWLTHCTCRIHIQICLRGCAFCLATFHAQATNQKFWVC